MIQLGRVAKTVRAEKGNENTLVSRTPLFKESSCSKHILHEVYKDIKKPGALIFVCFDKECSVSLGTSYKSGIKAKLKISWMGQKDAEYKPGNINSILTAK